MNNINHINVNDINNDIKNISINSKLNNNINKESFENKNEENINNYINDNKNEKIEINLESTEIEIEYRPSLCFSIFLFIFNFFIPGSGTFIFSCRIKNKTLKKEICLNGLCQILTWPLIIGWFFALFYSITFIYSACFEVPKENLFSEEEKELK